jgi:acetyltransferase-like isoleucine patch superfamily enzyme
MKNIKSHFFQMVESFLRGIGGGVGILVRSQYYKRRCKEFGRNVRIDVGVHLENPEMISFGSDIWVMPYTVITARPLTARFDNRTVYVRKGREFGSGEVVIGNKVAIGLYNIIHGYGGIVIGDSVTTSARVSIYSFSHAPYDPQDRSRKTFANAMNDDKATVCITSPLFIGNGAWLGLGVNIFGANVGQFSFVKAGSTITESIGDNLIVAHYPESSIGKRFESFL